MWFLVTKSDSLLLHGLAAHQALAHGISQARILEWVGDTTQVSCTEGIFFINWAEYIAFLYVKRNTKKKKENVISK